MFLIEFEMIYLRTLWLSSITGDFYFSVNKSGVKLKVPDLPEAQLHNLSRALSPGAHISVVGTEASVQSRASRLFCVFSIL